MSTITELNPRLPAHGLPAERVTVEGDPADAVRSLTARITQILQEG
jgi:hypothetical protein